MQLPPPSGSLFNTTWSHVLVPSIRVVYLLLLGLSFYLWTQDEPLVKQDQTYHTFADPGLFWNLLSNAAFPIGFLLSGWPYGPFDVWTVDPKEVPFMPTLPAFKLFSLLTSVAVPVGSVYYHVDPNDSTLGWDRFPMTLAFACTSLILLHDVYGVKFKRSLFYEWLIASLFSALWWRFSGDVTLYGFVQFVSILLPFKTIRTAWSDRYIKHTPQGNLIFALCLYILAKVCETLDRPIYTLTAHVVSGHSLKHVLAGAGCMFIYRYGLLQIRAATQASQKDERQPLASIRSQEL